MVGVDATVDETPTRPQRRRVYAPGGERRSKSVMVRVTPGEWENLAEAASANGGLSVGAYVGGLAQDAAVGRPLLPVTVIGELVAARQQLRRVGTNLNQVAAAVNSDQPLPGNTAAVLAAVGRAIARVEAAADRVGECYR
jgi:hypothetical protein